MNPANRQPLIAVAQRREICAYPYANQFAARPRDRAADDDKGEQEPRHVDERRDRQVVHRAPRRVFRRMEQSERVRLRRAGLVPYQFSNGSRPVQRSAATYHREVKTARTVPPGGIITSISAGENALTGRSVTMCRPGDPSHVNGARPRFLPSM